MKKLIVLFLMMIQVTGFTQELTVVAQTLKDGAFHFYWWQDYEKKVESFKKSSLNRSLLNKGLNILEEPDHKKLWSKFKSGVLSYTFFTNIENPIHEKFLIQRIKKTVRLYNKKGKIYSEKTTFLVEAFKTWTGYEQVEGSLKKADTHTGNFSHIGRNKRKIITKTFETGVGTIIGLAEDTSVSPFDKGSLYFGTGYNNTNGKDLFSKVQFTKSQTWTLNVEVSKSSFKIESPELGLIRQQ